MRNTIILLGLLVVSIANFGCAVRNGKTRCFSPSGEYFFETSINRNRSDLRRYLCVVVTIYDRTGKEVEEIQTGASSNMRWDIGWGDNDSILLDSGDIGKYKWEKVSSSRWELRYINPDVVLVIKLDSIQEVSDKYNINMIVEGIGGLIYTVYEPSDTVMKKIDGKDFYCYDLSTLAVNIKQTPFKLYLHKDDKTMTIRFEGFRDYYLTWNPIERYKPLQDVILYNGMILLDSTVDRVDLALTKTNRNNLR